MTVDSVVTVVLPNGSGRCLGRDFSDAVLFKPHAKRHRTVAVAFC